VIVVAPTPVLDLISPIVRRVVPPQHCARAAFGRVFLPLPVAVVTADGVGWPVGRFYQLKGVIEVLKG
jgi:hypothetical protein